MFQTIVVEKIETHILLYVNIFLFENRAAYVIMWKHIVEPDRPQMTIQGARALHAGLMLQTHTQNI